MRVVVVIVSFARFKWTVLELLFLDRCLQQNNIEDKNYLENSQFKIYNFLKKNKISFRKSNADDIFLKLVSEHLGLKSVIINEMISSISIPYKVQNSLYFKNVINNGNDVQIKLIENNFNKIIKNDFT
mgnify:CR=1 FL=1